MVTSKRIFICLLVWFTAFTFTLSATAQSEITLKLAVSEFVQTGLSTRQIIEQFEEENPGIRVEVVSNGNRLIVPPSSPDGLDQYLDQVAGAVRQADVVAVDSNWLLPEATQAGYFLDLVPLASEDASLDPVNFYPPAWEAFQWDAGLWALPTTYDLFLILYDPAAFDDANLSYPDGSWTLEQLENAARTLAPDDTLGLFLQGDGALGMLVRGLLGTSVIDDTVLPSIPNVDNPELASLLETLGQMQADGVMSLRDPMGEFLEAPMMIDTSIFALFSGEKELQVALLPGNTAGMLARGFGVSRGTQYPEAAYALARFLTMQTSMAEGGMNPARLDVSPPFPFDVPEEIQAVLDEAQANAFSPSELRFSSYLQPILSSEDIPAALQSVQVNLTDNLATVYATRDQVQIEIPPPLPRPTVAPGEIVLDFGVYGSLSPLPTRAIWERLADEFAVNDPQVGVVNLGITMSGSLQSMTESFDCFYMPYNYVSSSDLTMLRNIDPLLDADPTFDQADFVGNVLAQVTVDNRVWALPMTIVPEVMWYKPVDFEAAGLPFPQGSWTINEFATALDALSGEHSPVITPYQFAMDDTPLLLLIAAYGGLPFDYRTNPPTVNFTDPATVDAIRQVLDLAKSDDYSYQSLISPPPNSNSGVPPLILAPLDDANYRGNSLVTMNGTGSYNMTTYPIGTQYTPIAYDVGAGYISANAEDAEACYRFLSLAAQRTELFTGMPVRRAQITSPETEASRGAETVAYYTAFADMLQQPNTVEFPGGFNTSGHHRWLDLAFDRYIRVDADLEAELAEAELLTQAYFDCLETTDAGYPAQAECAQSVDPS